jgi:NAD(P)-dependent dehydrogenase (short-subunit alcohol dehydrogenase family)
MDEKVAVVTGASRGIGRGVAVALNGAGYRVFATGRTVASSDLPTEIRRITCDHRRDAETEAAFAIVADEAHRLDVLVNSAWGGYERMSEDGRFTWPAPFWQQPMHRWEGMIDGGVRAAFVSSACAARMMVPRSDGLIVNIGFWAAKQYLGNAIYGAAKAATDKLVADMAHELRAHNVTVVSLYPGLVRTELVLEAAKSGAFDLSNSESPEFIGRVVDALMRDPRRHDRTGQVVIAAALAREFGVRDIDGQSPEPLDLGAV